MTDWEKAQEILTECKSKEFIEAIKMHKETIIKAMFDFVEYYENESRKVKIYDNYNKKA